MGHQAQRKLSSHLAYQWVTSLQWVSSQGYHFAGDYMIHPRVHHNVDCTAVYIHWLASYPGYKERTKHFRAERENAIGIGFAYFSQSRL
uniref:Uncharacterized protein n=1 Tax=Trichuris muris TaxID=70415 RepID=A0A5S6QBR6_TRIMR